ncbi:MAG TPA: very short patch repair endonuclease [Bryobacteraceae bacterium]|nr:very short patch repair endonuclease [Bryobacteraceae bacterium]
MDKLTPDERSALMSRVKAKDSRAEMTVRSLAHRMGFRFRLHAADLPGKPDLVFRGLGKIVFIHGCFWHGHNCRAGKNTPASNLSYWSQKLERNKLRDRRNATRLRRSGWGVMTIWECQAKSDKLAARLKRFLESD